MGVINRQPHIWGAPNVGKVLVPEGIGMLWKPLEVQEVIQMSVSDHKKQTSSKRQRVQVTFSIQYKAFGCRYMMMYGLFWVRPNIGRAVSPYLVPSKVRTFKTHLAWSSAFQPKPSSHPFLSKWEPLWRDKSVKFTIYLYIYICVSKM